MNLDKTPVSRAIRDTAKVMRDFADSVERYADNMDGGGDIENATYAINTITNMGQNLRLDTIISRVIKAHEDAHYKALESNKD